MLVQLRKGDPCAPHPRSWTSTPICGLAQGIGSPHPPSLEVHLLGVTRALLGRRHSDWQDGCPVPALGAPAGLRDVRLRRKCPWEEVIWGTRLTSDLADSRYRRPLPLHHRLGAGPDSGRLTADPARPGNGAGQRGAEGEHEPRLNFPAGEEGVQRLTLLV